MVATIRSFIIYAKNDKGLLMNVHQSVKALILDMDGVLWRDTEPIGDLPAIFNEIDARGWKTAYVTNNATRSVDQYVQKLASFGVAANADQIINSGLATARYLKERYPSGGDVYIIGEQGLFATLGDYGFTHSEDNPLAVVASLDREVDYQKLKIATAFIRNGIPFLGTNPDPSLPTPGGYIPGTGAILAALSAASGQSPEIMGKPSPVMYQIALTNLEVDPEHALAIGDQMPTDIAAGVEAGCQTALVLTGVSTRETARSFDFQPTYIAEDLAQLIDSLE
ncbi:MAG: HAD-IIA family hydrolase [Anaerolineales bacterium]|nr:HAD-IIA family hydrolase [Anaerolineales bacterium]